jgi:uracil-DNA glycosylase
MTKSMSVSLPDPDHDCPLCPRLVEFRNQHRQSFADWFNGPVPNFGSIEARFLIVGLAPGLKGANRTGRPFTGDYAGDLLYKTLIKFGFAHGDYQADRDDGLLLDDCLISNAVRCVPPENKPTPSEIATCRPYLSTLLTTMKNLEHVLVLGRIAHDSFLRSCGLPLKAHPFSHGAKHSINHLVLHDSYHCSRYNTQTGVLTQTMFETVIAEIRASLSQQTKA